MSKKTEKTEKELALNQSNTTTKTLIKISSATAYKVIKFGTHKLDLKFRYNETNKTLSEYKQINLLNADNWKDVEWSDFSCNFSISEFSKQMGISDGGKQREEIRKMMSDITSEKIVLNYENKEKFFPWFVEAEFSYDENNTVQNLSFRFNPGVIGAALVNSGEHYSHLELLVIGKIKSFYGLRLYELIKSFYNKKGRYGNEPGTWKTDWFTIEFLKKFLQCENAYIGRLNNFILKAIKNPIEEINNVCADMHINMHVNIEIERGGHGGKQIKNIRFVCCEKTGEFKINKEDTKQLIDEKRMLNNESLEILELKEKYKNEWENIGNIVLELNKDNPLMKDLKESIFFEAAIISYIKTNLEK